jgi:hypothetical protein
MVYGTTGMMGTPGKVIKRSELMRVPEKVDIHGRYGGRDRGKAGEVHELGVSFLRIK